MRLLILMSLLTACDDPEFWAQLAEERARHEAEAVTYTDDVQPLLEAHCAPCHTGGEAWLPDFAVSYAAMRAPAEHRCEGETVGACVLRALEVQVPEGEGCRTVEDPFHREGWVCLDEAQIGHVSAWVALGMPER